MVSRIAILAAALVCATSTADATEQIWDEVRFERKTYGTAQAPLNGLWTKDGQLELPEFDVASSANWKGYTAAWEITDGCLYLTEFKASRNGKVVEVSEILPGRKLPAFAGWFTGRLIVPIGEKDAYGTWSSILVFHVTNGRVTKGEILFSGRVYHSWDGLDRPAIAETPE